MKLSMQQLFWDKLEDIVAKGVRSYEEVNVEDMNIDYGHVQYEGTIMQAWFGKNDEKEPKMLIKMSDATIVTELLIGLGAQECIMLENYFKQKNIGVEVLDQRSRTCISKHDESVFVRSCEVYRESFNQTNQLIAILDKELNMRYANKTLLDYLGKTMNELMGVPYWELTLWSHSTELQNKIIFSLEQMHLGNNIRFETTHQDRTGKIRDIDFIIKPIVDKNSEVDLLIAMGYDVTESKLTESTLKRTEKEMKLFFDYSVNGYYINRLDESVYLETENIENIFSYVQRHEKIFTYNNAILQQIDIPATTFENTNVFDLLHISREKSLEIWRFMIEDGHYKYEADIEVAGVRKILDCIFVPIIEQGNRYSGSFGIIKDRTEEVLQERKMIYLATKDSLTGTNNRRYFLETAIHSMRELTNQGGHPSVIMIDIDDFKNVNDTYGHDIGDKVLVEMTKTCEVILEGKGIYGRMGGEEFAAFLFNEDKGALSIAEELRSGIEALTIKTDLGRLKFTVSIGYTEVDRGHTMEEALKRADKALYKAKRTGKNKVETILI